MPTSEIGDQGDLTLHRARQQLLKAVRSRFDLELSLPYDQSLALSADHDTLVRLIGGRIIHDMGLNSRPSSIEQIFRTINTLIANLIHAHLHGGGYFVAVPIRPAGYQTKSRYNAQRIGYDNQRRVIEWFETEGKYLTSFGGFRNPTTNFSRSTRIIATHKLVSLLEHWGKRKPSPAPLSIFSIRPADNFECIRLKGKKQGKSRPRLIEYADTKDTSDMRRRLQNWNAFLERQWADLWATDEEFAALPKIPSAGDDREQETTERRRGVDLTRRRLYRVFNNGSFEAGGRFYGGWWQEIPSKWRSYITINGYPCRELDYSNFQPAMLYAMAGEHLKSYAYEIGGLDNTQRNKDAVKTTLFKLLYAAPQQPIKPLTDDELPVGWTWKRLREAVERRHAPIAHFFRSGFAPRMQRRDSDIAEDVMIAMMKRNILVLPIHDSFIVRSGHYAILRREMLRAYGMAMKSRINVTIDLSYVDNRPRSTNLAHNIISTRKDFERILKENREQQEGAYRGYYERRRIFWSLQSQENFLRFNPA